MDGFLPQVFIKHIRDGKSASIDDIYRFVAGITDAAISDAQIAAFTMAVFYNDFDIERRTALTLAVRDSGDVLAWPDLDGPVLDKHSTGGVGDNVSLILGPVIAACGGYVPMISGQGLGHTGGTLDKFSAIPGYQVFPDNDLFTQTVRDIGCAIIGQTNSLAPADKKLYAIRSTCASVESVTLITASILSKKLAAGLDGLVLDIKCGNGAFMTNVQEARALARSLVHVANAAGVKTSALLTDMNQPLASAVGNALEMRNAIEHLTGVHADKRLGKVVTELSAQMLRSGGLAATQTQARDQVRAVLDNGKAAEVFARMVASLGGPSDILESHDKYLAKAPYVADILAASDGIVCDIDTRALGLAVIVLGGGRKKADDNIDLSVGFDQLLERGTAVKKGDVLGRVHAASQDGLKQAGKILQKAYNIDEGSKLGAPALVIERITDEGKI